MVAVTLTAIGIFGALPVFCCRARSWWARARPVASP
jgi:hypothetical protein